ncbi:MAG TPA: DUF6335 family protein [Pyrinomonadaceae bacterium]|nr:DUF6335 family protein [Pyrinomonadaceae bacterium]
MIEGKELEFYEWEKVPNQKIDAERRAEIEALGIDPNELRQELVDNYPASPADSGGDVDAEWQEVETTGSESVFGHNPTPDQSDVEANAHAMGIDFQDNEPLDFVRKMEKRDEDRFELNEDSKSSDGTI